MTTINSIQDLIRLLRDQPQWADELRGILLSDELRDLPAAVRDLAQAVRESTASDRPAHRWRRVRGRRTDGEDAYPRDKGRRLADAGN